MIIILWFGRKQPAIFLKIEMNGVHCLLHDLKNFDYNHRRSMQASKWEWRSYSIIIIICLLSLSPCAFWSFIISITICFNSTLVWFVISSKLEAQSLTNLCEIIHLNGMFSLSVEYRNAKIHASSFARLVIISCDFLLIFIKINFRTFHLHKTTNAVFFFSL